MVLPASGLQVTVAAPHTSLAVGGAKETGAPLQLPTRVREPRTAAPS